MSILDIFKHKKDLKKDSLRLSFDSIKKKYVFYYGNQELTENELNRKTKKELAQKNRELKEVPGLLESQIGFSLNKDRYNYLKSIGYYCNSFEYLGSVDGTMSDEFSQYINFHTSKLNSLLGLHRVGRASEESIADMLKNGLKMTGHIGSGAITNQIELDQNVSYYSDNKKIIKELMYADQYKDSSGSILIEIPDEDLTSPTLYYKDSNGEVRLNPRYILGYVPVDKNHHLDRILTEKDFINSEDYGTSTTDYQSELEVSQDPMPKKL